MGNMGTHFFAGKSSCHLPEGSMACPAEEASLQRLECGQRRLVSGSTA